MSTEFIVRVRIKSKFLKDGNKVGFFGKERPISMPIKNNEICYRNLKKSVTSWNDLAVLVSSTKFRVFFQTFALFEIKKLSYGPRYLYR